MIAGIAVGAATFVGTAVSTGDAVSAPPGRGAFTEVGAAPVTCQNIHTMKKPRTSSIITIAMTPT